MVWVDGEPSPTPLCSLRKHVLSLISPSPAMLQSPNTPRSPVSYQDSIQHGGHRDTNTTGQGDPTEVVRYKQGYGILGTSPGTRHHVLGSCEGRSRRTHMPTSSRTHPQTSRGDQGLVEGNAEGLRTPRLCSPGLSVSGSLPHFQGVQESSGAEGQVTRQSCRASRGIPHATGYFLPSVFPTQLLPLDLCLGDPGALTPKTLLGR